MQYVKLLGVIAAIVVYVIAYNKLLKKLYPVIKPYLDKFYKGFLKIDEEIAQTKRFSIYEDNHRYNPGDPTDPKTFKHISFKIMACLIGVISLYGWFISRLFIYFCLTYYVFWLVGFVVYKATKNEKINTIIFCGLLQLIIAIVLANVLNVNLISLL